MMLGYFKESLKVLMRLRATLDRQEIDNLNEQFRLALTCFTHRLHQLPEARKESIVTDPQQRSARNITNAGSFDDQRPRPSFGKTAVPIEIVLSDEAFFSCAPRNHRRDPGAAGQSQ